MPVAGGRAVQQQVEVDVGLVVVDGLLHAVWVVDRQLRGVVADLLDGLDRGELDVEHRGLQVPERGDQVPRLVLHRVLVLPPAHQQRRLKVLPELRAPLVLLHGAGKGG